MVRSPDNNPVSLSFSALLALAILGGILPSNPAGASDIIVSNNPQCTKVGKNLLQRHASAEQIYVAVSLCEGIVHPMDSGIGGGFQAVLYDYVNNRQVAKYLMSREYSPYNAQFAEKTLLFGNSVGVPSVLAGYSKLLGVTNCLVSSPHHQRQTKKQAKYYSNSCIQRIRNGITVGTFDSFNRQIQGNSTQPYRNQTGVPYAAIFEESINLARYGFRVSPTFAAMYSYAPSLDMLIQYNRVTGIAINLRLANFLQYLSQDPLRLLDPYVQWQNRIVSKNHDIRRVMLEDVQYFNSKLTTNDFLSYRAKLNKVLSISFHYRNATYKLLTMPTPAGGEAVAFFAKMIEKIRLMNGRHPISHHFNKEKIATLFVLCSRFSYAIKPYFRQLKTTTRRQIILTDAPKIAERLYREVGRAKNNSQLVELINRREYRVPTNFNSIHLPQIRISDLGHGASLRTLANIERHKAPDVDIDLELEEDDDNLFDIDDSDDYDEQSTTTPAATATSWPLPESTDDADRFATFMDIMRSTNASQLYSTIDQEESQNHWQDNFSYRDEYMDGVDNNPYGTTNVIVKRGKRAIVATSSINHGYGSGILSARLGFFYNNVLRDFTPSTWYQRWWFRNGTKRFSRFANRAKAHSVPQSSMGCTLLVNPVTHNPVFGIGGAGGFKITGAIFNVLWNYFVQGYSLKQSINRLRMITKINYKYNITELWYELPINVGNMIRQEKDGNPFNSAQLPFKKNDLPHAFDFFYNNRESLHVKFIKEAGYSAITAFTTLRNVTVGSYDSRRGGRSYVNKNK